MEKLTWSPAYSLGIAAIDRQHEKMFVLIDSLEAGEIGNVRSEEFANVLNGMIEYAHEHFQTEEDLLRKYGYPEFEEHASQHLAFLERAAELNYDTVIARNDTPENTLVFLRLWWHHHILNVDVRYRNFLHDKGVR